MSKTANEAQSFATGTAQASVRRATKDSGRIAPLGGESHSEAAISTKSAINNDDDWQATP
jgi:hypothetical protein